ncbi:transglycosylase domain-containing protein [Sphingomonas sp. MMS24-JH45]
MTPASGGGAACLCRISADDDPRLPGGGGQGSSSTSTVYFPGLAGAILDYARKFGTGQRARGGSTITQQVAKNLLIGNEYSPTRKVREAILAYKIENTLTKPQILELYLNQIPLGRNAFGVEAARRAPIRQGAGRAAAGAAGLSAILPKGPANYDPFRHTDRALERRNWVLGEMERNGFITASQRAEAQGEPLGAISRRTPKFERVGGYFVEEVRRQLIQRFGESDRDGPYGRYSGGLWVRTSLDKRLQQYAAEALIGMACCATRAGAAGRGRCRT